MMVKRAPVVLMLLLLAVAPTVVAQSPENATQYVWVLDGGAGAGGSSSSSPRLLVYSPSGRFLLELNSLPGSGTARGFAFDDQGQGYLCRGAAVYQLDRSGVTTGIVIAAPTGAGQAQDVLQAPDGLIVVSWGNTASDAMISRHDSVTGTLQDMFTDAAITSPRRIATRSDPASSVIYVANSAGQSVVSYDPTAATPAITTVADLSTQTVIPVGMTYDAANDDLWIASTFGTGSTQEIGCIDLTGNIYSTAINYPTAAASGLTAPSGLAWDRFRRLYVAGRNRNSGTSGVYVFNVDSPTTAPTSAAQFPSNGGTNAVNAIDVAIQPSLMVTCSPQEAVASGGVQNILQMGTTNTVRFSSPETPGQTFAAALSFRSTDSVCGDPFQPGTLNGAFLFGGNDPRGIPLLSDGLFWGSVAVLTPGPSPVAPAIDPSTMMPFANNLSPLLNISGFQGLLNANGLATGGIDLTGLADPMNLLNLNGMELSLSWVTFDPAETQGFGFVAAPLCLILRNPAVVPLGAITPCP